MAEIAIRTERLSRRFGNLRAVDDLSFEVPSGIIFGFLGPNGAGKTTTIRLLLGLLQPTSGRADVLGFDAWRHADDIRMRTGALLEHTGLYERLSAEENLDFFGRIWHMPARERTARTRELLTHLGLWERRDETVGTWSRGMKQKLSVARTLFHHPSLVFMDEPTAGLDPVAAAALRDDLITLATREGVTIFLTTHNLHEAEKLCDHIGVIRQGRLLAVGPTAELRANGIGHTLEVTGSGFTPEVVKLLSRRPEVAHAAEQQGRLVIKLTGNVKTAPLVSLLVESSADVEEVHKSRASLEELFLALMEEER